MQHELFYLFNQSITTSSQKLIEERSTGSHFNSVTFVINLYMRIYKFMTRMLIHLFFKFPFFISLEQVPHVIFSNFDQDDIVLEEKGEKGKIWNRRKGEKRKESTYLVAQILAIALTSPWKLSLLVDQQKPSLRIVSSVSFACTNKHGTNFQTLICIFR